MDYQTYTDGGARGNPGPAAVGGVILADGKEIAHFSQTIGTATNNQAEYTALLTALKKAAELVKTGDTLVCNLDSELVVHQLNGRYKIKNQALGQKVTQVLEVVEQLKIPVTFSHVRREQNARADALVNAALDGQSF